MVEVQIQILDLISCHLGGRRRDESIRILQFYSNFAVKIAQRERTLRFTSITNSTFVPERMRGKSTVHTFDVVTRSRFAKKAYLEWQGARCAGNRDNTNWPVADFETR